MRILTATTLALLSAICAVAAYGCRESVPVVKPIPAPVPIVKPEIVTVTVEKIVTDPADAVKIGEQDKIAALTAELQKARQPASSQNCTSLATEPSQHAQAAVPSVVPVYERRGILRGRWRR